jgi:N-alpha-acetyltransferase 50
MTQKYLLSQLTVIPTPIAAIPDTMTSLALEFGGITAANIEQLRLINLKTLPVRYSNTFYNDLLLLRNTEYLKFAILNGFAVGSVCARVEDTDNMYVKKLYIMTLTVLQAYRRRGIASKLLNHVITLAIGNSNLSEIYLHVQTSNEDAMIFYKKHGFENVGLIENYYKRIEPADCYILRLDLNNLRNQ